MLVLKYLDQHDCHTWSFQPLHFLLLLLESVLPLAMPWLTSLPFWKHLFTFQLLTICKFTTFLHSHPSPYHFTFLFFFNFHITNHLLTCSKICYIDSLYWDFPGGSGSKESACNTGNQGSIPESGRSPGEGNDHPLQYCCLEKPMDRGTWWATVQGVTKSQIWLSD